MKTTGVSKRAEQIFSYKPKIFPRKTSVKKSQGVKSELSNEEMISLIEFTGYTEEEIQIWFSQFQTVCPGGVLKRSKVFESRRHNS